MTLQNRYISDTTRYSAEDIQSMMKPNTMYLMARNAGPGVDHYFYLYKNDKGEMYSISAFPKNDMSKSPTATAENIRNGGGGWGNIVSKVAKYDSKSPDWGNATFVQEFSSSTNNPQETAQAWQKVRRKYEVIQYADKPYLLRNRNSNSAANTVEIDLRAAMAVQDVNSQIMRRDIVSPGINVYIDTSYSGVKANDKEGSKADANGDSPVKDIYPGDKALEGIKNPYGDLSSYNNNSPANGMNSFKIDPTKVDNGSTNNPLTGQDAGKPQKETESNPDKWQELVSKNVQLLQIMNQAGGNNEQDKSIVDPVTAWINGSNQALQELNSDKTTPPPEPVESVKQQGMGGI
jgi:hypothetical protein